MPRGMAAWAAVDDSRETELTQPAGRWAPVGQSRAD
jgi:hypothetical protein